MWCYRDKHDSEFNMLLLFLEAQICREHFMWWFILPSTYSKSSINTREHSSWRWFIWTWYFWEQEYSAPGAHLVKKMAGVSLTRSEWRHHLQGTSKLAWKRSRSRGAVVLANPFSCFPEQFAWLELTCVALKEPHRQRTCEASCGAKHGIGLHSALGSWFPASPGTFAVCVESPSCWPYPFFKVTQPLMGLGLLLTCHSFSC